MGKASDHALLNIESERLSFSSCISASFFGNGKKCGIFLQNMRYLEEIQG